jgi:4-hydroxy-2-oxoheptanedioate aldolase
MKGKTMQFRKSRVLKKLRDGQTVCCFKLNFGDPRAAEIAALCGADCLWLDQEHVPTDWGVLEHQIRAAKLSDVDTMVRVAKGCYSDYIRPLEADAAGIMIPHLMSLKEAKEIVYFTRFHPIGRRPVDGGNADGKYCLVDFQEYIRQANRERFIVVQIEDPEPLAELDQIAAVEGIDMLFFGPADFSQGIGAPGQFNHPTIIETRKRIAEAAKKHGKFAGTVGGVDALPELIGMGYQFINMGADVFALEEGVRRAVNAVSGHNSKSQPKP